MAEPQHIERAAIRSRAITEIETMPKVTRAQRKATANFLDRLANAKRKHGDEEYANAAERQAQINRGTCECCGVKRVYVHPEHGQHYLCKTCSDEQIQLADDMWR